MAKGSGRFALVVFLGLACLAAGAGGAIVWGLKGGAEEIRSAPGFAAGWSRAVASPALNEVIGTPQLAPFNLSQFVQGRQSWTFTTTYNETTYPTETAMRTVRRERNEIEVPIIGMSGQGSLGMETEQVDGAWEVKKLVARIEGQPHELDLLGPAPPSAPPAAADPPEIFKDTVPSDAAPVAGAAAAGAAGAAVGAAVGAGKAARGGGAADPRTSARPVKGARRARRQK